MTHALTITLLMRDICTKQDSAHPLHLLLLQEYEEKAVELGLNHNKRLGLRQRLKDVRLSCPLFDTTQRVRDLEKIYFKMWDIHCEGQGPRTFDV